MNWNRNIVLIRKKIRIGQKGQIVNWCYFFLNKFNKLNCNSTYTHIKGKIMLKID